MEYSFYGRITEMDNFLPHTDDNGRLINEKATLLLQRLQQLDVSKLGLPDFCLHYYNSSHSSRLFFSIETSAHLLYNAVSLVGKPIPTLTIMDYGAGVGTLYLLAKLIGCKTVIYNDHLEDWKKSAQLIAEAIDIHVDEYIVGDIDDCLQTLQSLNIQCDIITSRNVVEHIYNLENFFKAVSASQPQAIVYSSTTANKNNPASVVKHWLWHRKWEKIFSGKRMVIIDRQSPGLTTYQKKKLAKATRGLAVEDLTQAVEEYRKSGQHPDPSLHGSNTCDPSNGVWAEHLLSEKEYRTFINENNYTVSFAPGFWDTHYSTKYMNTIGRTLNNIISKKGSGAKKLAPFIYVIAVPR